ncbi:MAG: hypothetical protein IKY52_08170 [Clostridia bacterium]|nr:hypothetical protein [Clostridia bacterium]
MKKFENWTIAYRRRSGNRTLPENTDAPFTCIPNTWRYWCADPHIITENGKTYIFAELYDRVLRRGVIGYCELRENGVTPWQIALKMPFHLSYPHLLRKDADIYMIPESYVADEIAVYKAVSFPDCWEKRMVLREHFCAVDSTILEWDRKAYMLTLKFTGDTERLVLFSMENEGWKKDGQTVVENDHQKRPGGHFFFHNGDYIRPAQDCSESYGCALNFYKVTSLDPYTEELVAKIKPDMLRTDLGRIADGIHTYNRNEQYEVIDLKGYETDILFYIMRPVWFIWRRIRKLLYR